MEIPRETYRIIGILCYLNHPQYLKNVHITCVEHIFDAMEEKIEELCVQISEMHRCLNLIQDKDVRILYLDKINNTKTLMINMIKQLCFIKK